MCAYKINTETTIRFTYRDFTRNAFEMQIYLIFLEGITTAHLLYPK